MFATCCDKNLESASSRTFPLRDFKQEKILMVYSTYRHIKTKTFLQKRVYEKPYSHGQM